MTQALYEVLRAVKKFGELACVSADPPHFYTGGKKPASKDVWQFPRHILAEIDAALSAYEEAEKRQPELAGTRETFRALLHSAQADGCIDRQTALAAGLSGLGLANLAERLTRERDEARAEVAFDLLKYLRRQRAFSEQTFGPGARARGVIDHIRKELVEVENTPTDLKEWIDVVTLALDGAWRAGYGPEEIAAQLDATLTRNENRKWPDWRTMPTDKAIEHVRSPAHSEEEKG